MEEYRKWIEQAKHDLKIAEYNLNGNFFDSCIFYCQQTVEKSLKSLIIKKQGKLLKIHDLVILGRKVNLPNSFFEKISKLNSAYLSSRYEISLDKIPAELFSKQEALEFLKLSKEVIKWVETQVLKL